MARACTSGVEMGGASGPVAHGVAAGAWADVEAGVTVACVVSGAAGAGPSLSDMVVEGDPGGSGPGDTAGAYGVRARGSDKN